MNFLKNRTWFLIPINIAIILILVQGFKATFTKSTSIPVILWFFLVVLFCVYVNIGLYQKLKKVTRETVESQLEAMREDE